VIRLIPEGERPGTTPGRSMMEVLTLDRLQRLDGSLRGQSGRVPERERASRSPIDDSPLPGFLLE
jgi:hypothetical protein